MLSTFQIRFVVLIVALGRVVDNSFSYRASPGSKIRCKWNCFAHVADLTVLKREMANSTTINNKLIKLIVRYEKQIDDKCTNQKSVNSSESSSEHCSVCLVNKRLFNSMTPNKSAINPFLHKEHSEIRAICTLKPARTTVSSPVDYSNRSFAICELIKFEADFESIDYHAVKTDPLGLCMNFTIPDRTNSTEGLQGAVKLRGWPKTVLDFFAFVFIGVFIYYSPAFLCLFCPTEILQDGVTHIILEGASPVSLRGLAGNYFFSRREGIWCKAKTFILRAFIIPLPFLISATVLADFEHSAPCNTLLSNRLFGILFGFCYCFQAFYISFFSKRSLNSKPCFLCKFLKPAILSCQDELPQLIINHLRLQPLILVECWRFCKRSFLTYLKKSVTVIPSRRCSLGFVIRLVLFISLLLCIPVVAAALLIFGSLSSFIGIIFTAPVITLCKDHLDRPSNLNSKISLSSFILSDVTHRALSCVSWYRAFDLLLSAAYGALNALVGVLQLSFSEEHVPYLACPVFILYYIWSSYSSFTKTYHELALTLYDCHMDSKRTQSQDVPSSSDQLPKLPNNTHDPDNVIAIPKELFEMACEKLLPLREGVCLLILKISVLVFFVLIVFSWATMFSFDTTPLMKTLLTFLTLAFPKIVAIYIDGRWQKKLREKVRKEKVPKIVEKFISRTSMTTRGQRDRNANIDEVNLVNEDCIELAVM